MLHRLIGPRSLLGGCAALALLGYGATAAAMADQTSPAATLVATAFKDARAAGSVHQRIANFAGGRRATFVNDVSGDVGTEQISVSGGISAQVVVTSRAAYVSGNQEAMLKYFGFPSSSLSTIGTRWVSIASTDAVYPAVADQATLA